MGALVLYDHFLTLDDEVCQSYTLSAVQRYIKPAQDILRLEEKEKLEWVQLSLDVVAPLEALLTPHVAFTSILPVYCGAITGL